MSDDDRDFGWSRWRLCGEEHGEQEQKKTRQVPAKLESTGVERPPPPPHVKIESSERVRVKVRVSHDQADQLTMVRLFFGCSENTNGGGHASESEGI